MPERSEQAQQENPQPIINIEGEKVSLGSLHRDLLPLYHRWNNDFEVKRTWGIDLRPITREVADDWYERVSKAEHDAHFIIYEKATTRPIGVTDLFRVSHHHRTAEFGIMIGEKDCWGKGYGTEVTRLMLEYGFTCLGLHNIFLTAVDYNQRGLRAYERAGFRLIGRRRENTHFGGRAYDEVFMDCLETEFQDGLLDHLLPQTPGRKNDGAG